MTCVNCINGWFATIPCSCENVPQITRAQQTDPLVDILKTLTEVLIIHINEKMPDGYLHPHTNKLEDILKKLENN